MFLMWQQAMLKKKLGDKAKETKSVFICVEAACKRLLLAAYAILVEAGQEFESCPSCSRFFLSFFAKKEEIMPLGRFSLRRAEEATDHHTLRAVVVEFLSTFIFVFAGEGIVMAFDKITGGANTTSSGLVAIVLVHNIALFVAIAIMANISSGHVNPVVTFGALVGGNITLLRAILYWIAQLLGVGIACLLLRFTTGGLHTGAFTVSHGLGKGNALVFEIVMTCGLVCTVYTTAKRGELSIIAPIAIGFIVASNILAGGPFSGAFMSLARAFGPILVSWTWRQHWIYWVGPFVGGGLAGIIYESLMVRSEPAHQPLTTEDLNS